MGSLSRFAALSPAERRLFMGAAGLLTAVRVGLWVLPFRWVHKAVGAIGSPPRSRDDARPTAERIVWAVEAAARRVPRTTCLVRALAAQALLARRGYTSQLRLGVTRGSNEAFEAHAWIEQDGRVLLGGPVEPRYVPMPALDLRR